MLIDELSHELEIITGNSGRASFREEDMDHPRALFAVCHLQGEPAGCGGIRQMSESTAEVKRLYARTTNRKTGVGSGILRYLEDEAALLGYGQVVLATRRPNEAAVSFYLRKGYDICASYGSYRDMPDAVCLSKALS